MQEDAELLAALETALTVLLVELRSIQKRRRASLGGLKSRASATSDDDE